METFEEKRAHFRVDMVRPIKGTAEIMSINGQKTIINKTLPLSILDLSAGGMRVETHLDLPTNLKIVLKVTFELDTEPFELTCELLRKAEVAEHKEYGTRFFNLSRRDEQRLFRSLNQYKIRQIKAKSTAAQKNEFKELECIIKMLEVLPYPAILINKHRVVVAANKSAEDFGAMMSERCHVAICKSKRKCSCCRLDFAQESGSLVEADTTILDKEYTVYWLYLDQEISLHYFKRKQESVSQRDNAQENNAQPNNAQDIAQDTAQDIAQGTNAQVN